MVPEKLCGETVRGSGGKRCKLRVSHHGAHSSVGYWCDGCNLWRRGRPHADGPEGLGFCYPCCKEGERLRFKGE